MVFEELAVGILNFVNYGITILVILLIIEIARLIGSVGGGKIASAAGSKFGWLGKKIFGEKAAEPAFDKTGKEIPIVPSDKNVIPLGPAKGKAAEKVHESTKEKEIPKDSDKKLYRALRRIWRYNKKTYKHLEEAHELSKMGNEENREKLEKELMKVIIFNKKAIDFEALVNDLVKHVTKLPGVTPSLKRRLNSLNNLLRINLSKIEEESKASTEGKDLKKAAARIVVAKIASEKIEKETTGLQALLKE